MIEVESIDFLFPWLAPKLRVINRRVKNLKKCRVVRAVRKTKKIIQRHPFISLFLGLSIAFGFLPFIVLGAFAGGSLFVTLFAALTALSGAFFVALACFLTVLLPVLITAASVVVLVYLPYCLAMKILRFLKRFGNTVLSYTSILQESFTSADYKEKAQFTGGHEQDFAPANKDMGGEHDNATRYLNKAANPHGKEYLHSLNGEEHRPQTEKFYFYNSTSGEDY